MCIRDRYHAEGSHTCPLLALRVWRTLWWGGLSYESWGLDGRVRARFRRSQLCVCSVDRGHVRWVSCACMFRFCPRVTWIHTRLSRPVRWAVVSLFDRKHEIWVASSMHRLSASGTVIAKRARSPGSVSGYFSGFKIYIKAHTHICSELRHDAMTRTSSTTNLASARSSLGHSACVQGGTCPKSGELISRGHRS